MKLNDLIVNEHFVYPMVMVEKNGNTEMFMNHIEMVFEMVHDKAVNIAAGVLYSNAMDECEPEEKNTFHQWKVDNIKEILEECGYTTVRAIQRLKG